MMKVLIVGYGEVGKPLFELVKGVYSEVEWLDIEDKKIEVKPDIMHIAYPEEDCDKFVSRTLNYCNRFTPHILLIEATVSPGTTAKIHNKLGGGVLVCHSPVRGNMFDGMKKGLLQYTKFIGPTSPQAATAAKEYYESLGLKVQVCSSPIETELGKIFETTYRGLMMSWFQEMHRICGTFGGDYDQVVQFIESTEKEGKQARPIFHPGVIGGHCIIPNAEKLYHAYPSRFAQALLESNQARQKETSKENR